MALMVLDGEGADSNGIDGANGADGTDGERCCLLVVQLVKY